MHQIHANGEAKADFDVHGRIARVHGIHNTWFHQYLPADARQVDHRQRNKRTVKERGEEREPMLGEAEAFCNFMDLHATGSHSWFFSRDQARVLRLRVRNMFSSALADPSIVHRTISGAKNDDTTMSWNDEAWEGGRRRGEVQEPHGTQQKERNEENVKGERKDNKEEEEEEEERTTRVRENESGGKLVEDMNAVIHAATAAVTAVTESMSTPLPEETRRGETAKGTTTNFNNDTRIAVTKSSSSLSTLYKKYNTASPLLPPVGSPEDALRLLHYSHYLRNLVATAEVTARDLIRRHGELVEEEEKAEKEYRRWKEEQSIRRSFTAYDNLYYGEDGGAYYGNGYGGGSTSTSTYNYPYDYSSESMMGGGDDLYSYFRLEKKKEGEEEEKEEEEKEMAPPQIFEMDEGERERTRSSSSSLLSVLKQRFQGGRRKKGSKVKSEI